MANKSDDLQTVIDQITPKRESIDLNIRMPQDSDDNSFSILELLHIFKKNIFKIVTISFIFLLIGIVVSFIYYFVSPTSQGSTTGMIAFNYKGAEEGLDPNGYTLTVEKIKSAVVIDSALSVLGLHESGVTVEDIRQNIVIQGVVPADAMERLLIIKEIAAKNPSNLEKISELSYIPTQYKVTLYTPEHHEFLKGARATELLSAIFSAFEQYFFEEYGDRSILNTVAIYDISNYDYIEIPMVLNEQINSMVSYLESKRVVTPDFRSQTTKRSFGDIINNLKLIQSIDIDRFAGTTETLLLTKDATKLRTNFEYQITKKTMEMEIQLENARIAQEAAQAYEKGTTTIVGTDSTVTQFQQSSDTYDLLTTQASDALQTANRLQHEINYYTTKINDIQTSGLIPNRPEDILTAERDLTDILDKLDNWINIANQTVDEYIENEALKDSTRVILAPHYLESSKGNFKVMLVIVLGVTFLGFIISTLYSFSKKLSFE